MHRIGRAAQSGGVTVRVVLAQLRRHVIAQARNAGRDPTALQGSRPGHSLAEGMRILSTGNFPLQGFRFRPPYLVRKAEMNRRTLPVPTFFCGARVR